jgi:superfamily I DNA/RNA helicase
MADFGPGHKLTDEQAAIIEAKDDLLAVTAYAGTGKTSTLRAFAGKRPRERMLYLAFNKSLSEESKEAFRSCPNVEVRTIHSLAYSHVGRKFSGTVGEIKAYALLPYVGGAAEKAGDDPFLVARVVNDALQDFLVSSSPSLEAYFKERRMRIKLKLAEVNLKPRSLAKLTSKVWEDSRKGLFPMPHNGYLKLFQLDPGGRLDAYDRILVDEAQDLNDCMISLVAGCASRKIFVGDPYQQIYGFNGAVNALSERTLKGAAVHYLTRSFRCPADVAEKANQYLKVLDAPKPFTGTGRPAEARGRHAGSLVIARTNAGVFDFVARRSENPKFFYIGGFDGYQFDLILELVHLMNNQPWKVRDRFFKKFERIDDLKYYADKVRDSVTLTRIKIAGRYKSDAFAIYERMLENAADERSADYVVTTAHKIKGREHERVILLDDFASLEDVVAMGRKRAEDVRNRGASADCRPGSINLEELRLLYVAITRSQRELTLPATYELTDDLVEEFRDLACQGHIEVIDQR